VEALAAITGMGKIFTAIKRISPIVVQFYNRSREKNHGVFTGIYR